MNTIEALETQHRDAVDRMMAVQTKLGTIVDKTDTAREALKWELETLVARTRELKEQIKTENARRNFAGLDSPFAVAAREQLSADAVLQIETHALAIQDERNAVAAARRAAKAATAAAPPASPAKSDLAQICAKSTPTAAERTACVFCRGLPCRCNTQSKYAHPRPAHPWRARNGGAPSQPEITYIARGRKESAA